MNDWLTTYEGITKRSFDHYLEIAGKDKVAAAILCGFDQLAEMHYYTQSRLPEYLVHELAAYNNPIKDIASALGDIASAISERDK